jgi:hypothetical protein
LIWKGHGGDRREGDGMMIQQSKGYDGDLQMFRDAPQAVNLAHLRFQRWLIEQGWAEHGAAGPPAGELAEALGATSTLRETDELLPQPTR